MAGKDGRVFVILIMERWEKEASEAGQEGKRSRDGSIQLVRCIIF